MILKKATKNPRRFYSVHKKGIMDDLKKDTRFGCWLIYSIEVIFSLKILWIFFSL
jgi:hypothetical protein